MRGLLVYVCIMLCFSCSNEKKASSKPNILFILIDDLAFDALQYQGNSVVKTPNIDRLAERSVSFTHTYNMGSWSGAVCTASRSMLVSGMTVWRANEHRKKWKDGDAMALAQCWPRLLANEGYDTYFTGKWHVDLPVDSAFRIVRNVRPGMPRDYWNVDEPFPKRHKRYINGEITYNELMPKGYNRPLDTVDDSWSPTDTSLGGFWEGGVHWSEVITNDVFDFAQSAAESAKPFFMYVAFNAAHDPRQSPQEYIDMYPIEDILLPENFKEQYDHLDDIGVGYGLRDEALAPFPRTEYAVKVHLQEYYALISHLDTQIGRILDHFEDEGLLDNTVIALTADHGLAMGSHGLMGKQNMYDHSMRVPFLISGPGISEGQKIDSDIYLQDIMPTTLDLAHVAIPEFVEFNSLVPMLEGGAHLKREGIYGAYLNLQRMIRKDDYKLIVYPKINKSYLYNLTEDPLELNDLSDAKEMNELRNQLFLDLKQLQKKFDDPLDLGSEPY